MKKSLLLGLAALVFGGLTSCNNILEGEIKTANSDTGVLSLSLEQDNSINVITKAGTFDGSKVSLSESEIDDFDVTVTKGETTIAELTGKYRTMGDAAFAWDSPCFYGTVNATVSGSNLTTETIKCSLSNSIVVIDAASLEELKKNVTITNMVVITGAIDDNSSLTSGVSLLESGNLKTGTLYAAPNSTDAKIVLEGYLTNDPGNLFRAKANILTGENVGAKNKYNVNFSLNSDKGSLSIAIEVNGEVANQPIEVPVDPYK